MSGRIRSIKPELLEDRKTAGLSPDAFRLFIGAILLADDFGNLRAEIGWLEGQVFWSTPATGGRSGVEECMDELTAAGLLVSYESHGQQYAAVTGWQKHQKVDHPGKPRVPGPNDDGSWRKTIQKSDRVYLIQAEDSKSLKIGVSWNPARRLATLRVASRESLRMVAEISGGVDTERQLHKKFDHLRLSGEWFSFSDEIINEFTNLANSREPSRDVARESSRGITATLAPDHDHDHDHDHEPTNTTTKTNHAHTHVEEKPKAVGSVQVIISANGDSPAKHPGNNGSSKPAIPSKPLEDPNAPYDFDPIFAKYPKGAGRAKAVKLAEKEIFTDDDYDLLALAVKNYALENKKTEAKFLQSADRFMANWRDYAFQAPPSDEGGDRYDVDLRRYGHVEIPPHKYTGPPIPCPPEIKAKIAEAMSRVKTA